ncbi:hypothetical protein FXO37_11164 [Capsicum annuum]|nr:hypothetical protein FXO37_11164 [Capsicum annuum]
MCRHTRCIKNRNEDIRDKVIVASVVDKLREVTVRWFGHVKRRCAKALDMVQRQLVEDMTLDRRIWRSRNRVSPHKRGIRNGPKALKPVPVIMRCRVCGRVKLPHFFCCSGIKPGDENSSNS